MNRFIRVYLRYFQGAVDLRSMLDIVVLDDGAGVTARNKAGRPILPEHLA